MKNLFNNTDKQEVINRLNALTPASKPNWGKMDVAQMLKHCTLPLKLALTNPKPKRKFLGYILGPIIKNPVIGPKPFAKNSFTPPEFRVETAEDYSTQKEKLLGLLNNFNKSNITDAVHPFFGKLTHDEWGESQFKHLDHHLVQFGV